MAFHSPGSEAGMSTCHTVECRLLPGVNEPAIEFIGLLDRAVKVQVLFCPERYIRLSFLPTNRRMHCMSSLQAWHKLACQSVGTTKSINPSGARQQKAKCKDVRYLVAPTSDAAAIEGLVHMLRRPDPTKKEKKP